MKTESQALFEFKKQVEALKKYRGRGTELISVYITPGYPISDITSKLKDEYGQAANIKSKSTQKNVQAALERIMHHLKSYDRTPENGVAVFAGNVSEKEGKIDYQLFSVEPPVPLGVQFYRCESTFVLEPLEELMDHAGCYGLVVLDGKDATVATLKGKQTRVIKKLHSTAHQKVHKGGQCIHENTLVTLADGSKKPIKQMFEGDEVLSADYYGHRTRAGKVTGVYRKKIGSVMRLATSEKELLLSKEHQVFFAKSHSKGVMPVNSIENNAKLVTQPENNELKEKTLREKIIAIEPIESNDYFMDLTIEPTQAYFANGVLVHNSAARYDRLHTEGVEYYYKRIGDAMNAFVGLKNFKGVIVGGPGPAKHDFVKMNPFNYQLKILGVVDTGYTDEYGIRETIGKASELMADEEIIKEKQVLEEFLKRVSKGGLAAYGYNDIHKAIESGQAEKLLVTEGLEMWQIKQKCGACGKERVKIDSKPGSIEPCECGGKWQVVEEHDLINDLIGKAEENAIEIEFVSRETGDGNQFYGMFNGLGAFLRYK